MIELDDFVAAVSGNRYWAATGALPVLEMMYLDCVHTYHETNKMLLGDDEYEAVDSRG